jgi:hypothetical protein
MPEIELEDLQLKVSDHTVAMSENTLLTTGRHSAIIKDILTVIDRQLGRRHRSLDNDHHELLRVRTLVLPSLTPGLSTSLNRMIVSVSNFA